MACQEVSTKDWLDKNESKRHADAMTKLQNFERSRTSYLGLPVDKDVIVCIAEDRQSCEPALRLLIASMDLHCPTLAARLYCPNASQAFVSWIEQYDRHVLITSPLAAGAIKYDIKPVALLATLAAGFNQAIWVDSDILISRDFLGMLRDLPRDTLAVTEEALCSSHADPDALRARLWRLPIGRILPFTVNTGVIRVTDAHLALLERWNQMLQCDLYREAQDRPWNERELHLMGDQEVMTALLSSAEFSDIPIYYLRRGCHIIQYFGSSGYTMRERIHHLRYGSPFFVHSQGFRPWWPREDPRSGIAARFVALYNELSPYTVNARAFSSQLTDTNWLTPRSTLARFMIVFAGGRPALAGMPLAFFADILRKMKKVLRKHT